MPPPLVLSGSANRSLGEALARELGESLVDCKVERFPDGEWHVELAEEVRGREVAIVQSTGPPAGENLLELLLLADACHRSGARLVTGVIPYLCYARQDRRWTPGEPVGASVIAGILEQGGFDHLVAVDLHNGALEGIFDAPLEHVSALPELADRIRPSIADRSEWVVVSPDIGGLKRAERFARRLGLAQAVVHKERLSGSEVSARGLVGHVRGRRPIIVDDLISTGHTIAAAIELLREHGCLPEITVVASHPLLVAGAVEVLARASIQRFVTTDSIGPPRVVPFKYEVVTLAPLLARTLRRLHPEVPSERRELRAERESAPH